VIKSDECSFVAVINHYAVIVLLTHRIQGGTDYLFNPMVSFCPLTLHSCVTGSIPLGDVAKMFDRSSLSQLKNECGGLQTLLRNKHQIFMGRCIVLGLFCSF
jgi:hypothetical protein